MATYGIKDICKRYGVGEHTVLGWIKRGELKAINVGRQMGGRPKWRATESALADFERLRGSTPADPPQTRKRRRVEAGIIERY